MTKEQTFRLNKMENNIKRFSTYNGSEKFIHIKKFKKIVKKTGQPNFTKGLKLARKRLKFAEKENRVATFTNSAEFTQSREYSRRYFFDLLKGKKMYVHTYIQLLLQGSTSKMYC